jgi:hypothetical protein
MTNNKINKLKNIIHLYTNTENMTNNKQQTAVDTAINQIYQCIIDSKNPNNSTKRGGDYRIGLRKAMEILENLKEMEKEQTINFADDWYFYGPLLGEGIDVKSTIERHYNQTYGGGEQ